MTLPWLRDTPSPPPPSPGEVVPPDAGEIPEGIYHLEGRMSLGKARGDYKKDILKPVCERKQAAPPHGGGGRALSLGATVSVKTGVTAPFTEQNTDRAGEVEVKVL